MRKNIFYWIGAAMMLVVGLSSCSKTDDEEKANIITGLYGFSANDESADVIHLVAGDMNVLQIQSENGDTELCSLYTPWGSLTSGQEIKTEPDGSTHTVYHLGFSAMILNSSLFNVMTLDIESDQAASAGELKVGDTFDSSVIQVIAFDNRNTLTEGRFDYAKGGQVQVVDLQTDDNGRSHITISLQDLKFNSFDQKHSYTLNATIDYVIAVDDPESNETQPDPISGDFDMETALIPSDELISFMMDALYKNETQGRHTFFSEDPEEQKCLIINSIEEFREAYKGDKDISPIIHHVNFNYCTLVIGRTYGEHSGMSLGDYELTDNGDTYQLDVTLNNNINPNLVYTTALTDLYFWKIYPKMENKPVVFNRIKKDVNYDPFGDDSEFAYIRKRWFLQSYSDAEGTTQYNNKDWGDERYSIEFTADGRVQGSINTNEFSGYYNQPYACTYDGKRDGYNGYYRYGLINMRDVTTTQLEDDEPLSKSFMHIFNAIEYKIWTADIMTITTSDHEVFGFFRENIKKIYGY